ncbi:hypothetical protein ACE1B6_16775 [Aerosakkonemataceae cyanobacterium BLCC-F154]|uniref:Uncharacterized protein n=1 Tax=Floridaenema fluviatile BLCC-F154 TaxID=3153640 RepID=A0ABV4YDJ4_9CYAN
MTAAKDLEILNDDLEDDDLEDVIFPPGDLLSDSLTANLPAQ